jgi:hypothetical protein
MNISAKFDSNLFCGFRKKDENVNPTWLPGPIMCSDWSKFKKIFLLETTKPIEL